MIPASIWRFIMSAAVNPTAKTPLIQTGTLPSTLSNEPNQTLWQSITKVCSVSEQTFQDCANYSMAGSLSALFLGAVFLGAGCSVGDVCLQVCGGSSLGI